MLYSKKYEKDIIKSIQNIDLSALGGKKILITGATGLIGSAIIDILCTYNSQYHSNIQIYAAVRNIEKARERFKQYQGNLYLQYLPYDALQQISFNMEFDFIICAAGNAHPSLYRKEPVETMTASFYGLNGLLRYAKSHAVKRLLYVSSSEVYGKKKRNTLYREDEYGYVDFLNPRACYPSSKRVAETLCAAYLAEYGVDSVIVRPGHIYGPTQTENDSRASAQFLRLASMGKDIIMKSSGLQLRSYCHCFDCATAILTVLLKGKCGEAYNISNPNSIITIREFAEICAQNAGVKITFEVPKESEKASYNMMECSALDSNKLENLGWAGSWTANEGIEETLLILRNRTVSY